MNERAGTFDGVHRRNLSKVLRLVHRDGPLPRARITAETGLNRSTVASLVAELAEGGLVAERAPDATNRVGRPSPIVAASDRVGAIAVNPEIDAVSLAVVALDRSVRLRRRIETDGAPDPETAVGLVRDAVEDWRAGPLAGHRIVGVGLAVPGLVRAEDGLVRWAPHLGWREAPIRELVEAALGLPAVVGNDASLGAHAEHLFGAGRGDRDLVYLNGGASGIGGGLVVDGRLVGGAGGYAGEFGRNRPGIAADDDRRAPGGVLEDEVNRQRLLEVAGLATADESTLAAALLEVPGAGIAAELARQRRILATALGNAVNVLNPAAVVLGGFLATLLESDPGGLRELVAAQTVPAAFDGVELRPAELGEDRLAIGAAEAAFHAILRDPLG